MTRETKIGLLVGLAFIIVIGILLSDHLTSATEPQQAQLAQAGSNVRTAVTTPGGANPPVTTVVTPPAGIAPQQPVPSREDLAPRQPPIEIVKIGGQPQAPQTITVKQHSTAPAQQPQQPAPEPGGEQVVASAENNPPAVARASEARSPAPSSLAGVAKAMGEELVSPNQPGGQPNQLSAAVAHATGSSSTAAASAESREYKAETGDSVSKMASKFLGGNTRANRDAIIAANPALQQDANKVIVGRTYVIPNSSATANATVAPKAAESAKPQAPPKEVASSPEYFYTVKSGDSLTRIAVMQLGTPDAVAAIKDLNKDLLKGGEIIRPNMKLRLPAKPVASAE